MTKAIGAKDWAIAEGYIPTESHSPQPQMTSHETVCLLNASDQDAHVERGMFASMISAIQSRYRATPISPA